MSISFTQHDIEFMKKRGSNPEVVAAQFHFFSTGFNFANLHRMATIADGVIQINVSEKETLLEQYRKLSANKKIIKFVPASGAASRMFKAMYEAVNNPNDEKNKEYARHFLSNIKKFAFYEVLKDGLEEKGFKLDQECVNLNFVPIFNFILENEGLNYGNLPKGVLLFHRYDNENRTALEEHLVEAATYASANAQCYLHFTVSPQHQEVFNKLIDEKLNLYEAKYKVKYHISFSNQDLSTDTLAANADNTPFRDEQGNLFFRPAGHGALISNLNKLDGDIIFVKNIDNVTKEESLAPTIQYKQIIAGLLLQLQQKTFHYLEKLIQSPAPEKLLEEVSNFAKHSLNIQFNDSKIDQEALVNALNRPMRICGVVKNEGEPGGGPFWVTNNKGVTSCQIVETSQIDIANPQQNSILKQAAYFNPVDMVCGIKNYKDEVFDLQQYVDPLTGFISEKSQGMHTIKVMELPGLWNGAMANWITIFVEVPLATFNPVKTVTDLLRR